MAGSSDISPLRYPMLWNDWVRLISEKRTAEVRQGGKPRKFCVQMVTDRIWQEHLLPSSPSRDRVQERATW